MSKFQEKGLLVVQTTEMETDEKLRCYSLRIGEHLHIRIDNHIHLLKKLESRSHSKQKWLEDAVREKLDEEENLSPENLPRDRYLAIKFNKFLSDRMDKQIQILKKFRVSYSTRLWVIEAICRKLEMDEEKVKRLLDAANKLYEKNPKV